MYASNPHHPISAAFVCLNPLNGDRTKIGCDANTSALVH